METCWLFTVTLLLNFVVAFCLQSQCQQEINCKLPACFCSTTRSILDSRETPQIVYFGFDDALNVLVAKHYRDLFAENRKNPNGCPISMSLYVQDEYTDYNLVNEFYQKGMEIGVHSVTHTDIDTAAKLEYEAGQQRKNLAFYGKVPINEILGWRSPNLKTAGDAQPVKLQQLEYTYDISLTYTRHKYGTDRPWPYTLDYGYPFPCMVEPCPSPKSSHKGFWEVPVNSLVDYKNQYPCPYVDGCWNGPSNEEDSYKYLWQNFLDYYQTTRTPLGLNMHAAWFMTDHNKRAMDRFITKLTTLEDVYIVSVNRMLDWVRHPTKLSEIFKLPSWNCGNSIRRFLFRPNPQPRSMLIPATVAATHLSTTTTQTTSSLTTRKPTTRRPKTAKMIVLPQTRAPRPTRPKPMFRAEFTINSKRCLQSINCKLPNCFCRTTSIPRRFARKNTPQMVFFTFDGPVNGRVYSYYNNLFSSSRRNPNGCPISSTFFVSRSGNFMPYLYNLASRGLEIGLRGDDLNAYKSVRNLSNDLNAEIDYLRTKLPVKNMKGWRSPAMKPLGNEQYRVLKTRGITYDSTLVIPAGRSRQSLPWPYTLDFGWQERCEISGCPTFSFPGLWEVPVTPLVDYRNAYLCTYADGCMFNPQTAEETFKYLWNNFQQHYNGNRSPFGITLRHLWFSHPTYLPYLLGLDNFINKLLTMDDVYILSIDKITEWMKQPTPLSEIVNFRPWMCY